MPRPSALTVPPAPFPETDGSQPCAQTDPELFFPSLGENPRAARELCAGCPFRRPCLAYALTHGVVGVWGGTTERERDALRRAHGLGRPVPMTSTGLVGPRPASSTQEDNDDPAA